MIKSLVYTLFSIILLFNFSCRNIDKEKKNILNYSLSGEISTLDPANAYDTISASIVYQVYEQLYEYHYLKRPYTLEPLLADGLPKVEDNGKKYIIKIRKGIRYHDDPSFKGKPRYLVAQDFITQIKRLAFLSTKSNGWWLFDQRIVGLNEFRKKADTNFEKFKSLSVEGLQAPDDHTLIIKLNEPYPQMLYALAMSFTSPIPIEVVEHYKNLLNNNSVGTGPFKLEKWESPANLKLSRFENYRDEQYPSQGDRWANSNGLLKDAGKSIPFLDGINFHVIKESQTRWLNFRSKKIDLLNIPKDNYANAIDESGNLTKELKLENIHLQIFTTLTYWWLAFNMKDQLLGKNLNLRKAIAHAVDIEQYILKFTRNTGQRANSIYPPGIPGYDPARQLPYEYNVEKAKQYLALAGYPGGKGLPTLRYDVRGASTTNRQQAEFIKAELAKIGIDVQVNLNTFPAFLNKARNGNLQFWQGGWSLDYPDAENVLQLLTTQNHPPGPNDTYYSNPEFDQLFSKLKLLKDGNEKFDLMERMESIVNKDLPWVMQYYARNYTLYHDRLRNFRHSDIIYNFMKYLRIEQK